MAKNVMKKTYLKYWSSGVPASIGRKETCKVNKNKLEKSCGKGRLSRQETTDNNTYKNWKTGNSAETKKKDARGFASVTCS